MDSIGTWAILAGVVLLALVGLLTMFKPRRRGKQAAAVIEECTIIDGAKACTRRAYESPEEMPPEVRAAYEQTANRD